MATMSTNRSGGSKQLSDQEIDELVTSEAQDESAWEEPIEVHPASPTSFAIPGDLAARAAFLARIHHTGGVEEWLTRIICERIELEENAFAEAKRDIAGRAGARSGN
jgi:hypothetical protein